MFPMQQVINHHHPHTNRVDARLPPETDRETSLKYLLFVPVPSLQPSSGVVESDLTLDPIRVFAFASSPAFSGMESQSRFNSTNVLYCSLRPFRPVM